MKQPKLEKNSFFKKYNLEKDVLENSNLNWESLQEIYETHVNNIGKLESTAKYIADRLQPVPQVHSLKIRVKDPEHLIEKIIRKSLENTSLGIDANNYIEKITDLIGIRALHLFKSDWAYIHEFVESTWELQEPPTVNIRRGDPEELIRNFKEKGCEIKEHKFGYRSIHYLIKSQPAKELFIAELQVRTIFEEGWSEIDHQTRYPYAQDDLVLGEFLVIFNRLAGSADEMGEFIKFLKKHLDGIDYERKSVQLRYEETLSVLNDTVKTLKITQNEKQKLEAQIKSLARITAPADWLNIFSSLTENQISTGSVAARISAEHVTSGIIRRAFSQGAELPKIDEASAKNSSQKNQTNRSNKKK